MSVLCYILAAGSNKYAGEPCVLWNLPNGQSILDWHLRTVRSTSSDIQIKLLLGYKLESIVQKYTDISYIPIPNWQAKTPIDSMLQALEYSHGADKVIFLYGDTVFHRQPFQQVYSLNADVVIGVDSTWQKRFQHRSAGDIDIAETLMDASNQEVEYTGLLQLSQAAVRLLLEAVASGVVFASIMDCLQYLRSSSTLQTVLYDVHGHWAEMNDPHDFAHFILGTKAETLRRIRSLVKKSIICDQVLCTWHNWQTHQLSVLAEIQAKFEFQPLIIRSSCSEEDSWDSANAGVFDSVLNVDSRDSTALVAAIEQVFASYPSRGDLTQVLVQPFITQTTMSGVIFTCSLDTGAPYYTINYDDQSGSTESVTSGTAGHLRTIVVHRDHAKSVVLYDKALLPVIEAVEELQQVLGFHKLDIEFAVDRHGQVFTFQVRPIVVDHQFSDKDEEYLAQEIQRTVKQYQYWQAPALGMLGQYTVFSNMTDWNPAEIIGIKPKPLARSLYHFLVTDHIWAQQRAEYGYRHVYPAPLVHYFCGQPYVDCRASINSFIPAGVPEDSAQRIAQAYLQRLYDHPHLHDKLELEVVFTIWEPRFQQKAAERLSGYGVTIQDIVYLEQHLKVITKRALERLDTDLLPLKNLESRYSVLTQRLEQDHLGIAYALLKDCQAYGTLCFAHAARAGFVAITLLKSFVQLGVITAEEMLAFQASVHTVTTELHNDLSQEIPLNSLVAKYGHLRPGTYDITQSAYWENPGFYFTYPNRASAPQQNHDSALPIFSSSALQSIQEVLSELSSEIDVTVFLDFCRQAIQARENVKFIFTKNLSNALDSIILFAEQTLEISREGAAYIEWSDIDRYRTGQMTQTQWLQAIQQRQQTLHQLQHVRLPSMIRSETEFWVFEQMMSVANFITQKTVVAVAGKIESLDQASIQGKIVCIPNADPGFDWLFSHAIAGLVTQYGGANSHMAIRCAELGIPAAIGVGDKRYAELKEGNMLLDCLNGIVSNV